MKMVSDPEPLWQLEVLVFVDLFGSAATTSTKGRDSMNYRVEKANMNKSSRSQLRRVLYLVAIAAIVVWVAYNWNRETAKSEDGSSDLDETFGFRSNSEMRNTTASPTLKPSLQNAAGSGALDPDAFSEEKKSSSYRSPVDLDIVDAYMSKSASNSKANSQVETRIVEHIATHDLNVEQYSIDCRGLVCRITLQFKNKREAAKIRNVRPTEGSQFTFSMQRRDEDNSIIVTVYRTLPGYTFAEVLSGTEKRAADTHATESSHSY